MRTRFSLFPWVTLGKLQIQKSISDCNTVSDNFIFIKVSIILIAISEFFYCVIQGLRGAISISADFQEIIFRKISVSLDFYLKYNRFFQGT